MRTLFNTLVRRFRDALRGLRYAAAHDNSFQLELVLGVALVLFAYIMRPLTALEAIVLALSWLLVLITELQNTSLEVLIDKLHPERDELIGRSKDIAAGAVIVALIFMGVVIAWILSA